MGESGPPIPRDVIRVRVHPSVTAIPAEAFSSCDFLEEVDLPEGLQQIGQNAFSLCVSLHRIKIPSTRSQGDSTSSIL